MCLSSQERQNCNRITGNRHANFLGLGFALVDHGRDYKEGAKRHNQSGYHGAAFSIVVLSVSNHDRQKKCFPLTPVPPFENVRLPLSEIHEGELTWKIRVLSIPFFARLFTRVCSNS